MPYKTMEEVNPSIKGIKPSVSLEQANLIAQWADKIKAAGGADEPWAVAIGNFKKAFKVQDGKWVRKKELEALDDPDVLLMAIVGMGIELQEEGERDKAKKAQQARANKYGISIKATTNVTKPKEYANVADDDFLDAVNYRYPVDSAHLTPALQYFNHGGQRGAGGYTPQEWAKMGKKLSQRLGKGYSYSSKSQRVESGQRSAEDDEPDTTLRYFSLLELDEADTPDFARNRNPDGTPKWIPVHRLGEWDDPRYGHFDMTEKKMEQAVANFYGCIHRPESPIDAQVPVDTRHQGDPASGWLQDMRIAPPYLWGKPRWTDKGRQVVLDKQYRYVSPRYLDDPQRGPVFQEITLTNRDFLKMPPLDGEGPTVFLSDDAQAIVIHRTEEVSNVDKIKLTVGGEEKELSLEEVQKLLEAGDLTAKELADVKVELEKTKKSQDAPREAITLTKEDGTEVVLTASAVAGMMQDNETYRKERKERDVRDALRELQEKNVEPIICTMMEPILRVLDPEAATFIQLEAGPVSKAFGFVDEKGNALAGKMNLWLALNRLIQQIPERSIDPRTLLAEGVRPKDALPAAEDGQYDPNAISLEEIEAQEKWAAGEYKEQGKTPRIHAEQATQ